jgi:hypothetical protein
MAEVADSDKNASTELWKSATIIVTLSQLPPSPADCPKYYSLETFCFFLTLLISDDFPLSPLR